MVNDNQNKKVFVALSGGVDSAVSAALLKDEGYDVTGVYMKNWSGDDFGIQADCPWEVDQADAEEICNHLEIEFRSFNFEKEYRDKVVAYFFDEYRKGRTPNPDVMCNKEIKFQLFLEKALEEGADLIATGHYARVTFRQAQGDTSYELLTGNDDIKNQVYFLYNINQEQLAKTLFPIGHMPKSEVRKLAEKYELPNKNKPDSQGICFIGEINVLQYLMANIEKKPGDIVDIDTNKKVGEHEGIYFHTIGQRKGLGIGGQEVPYFVVDKDSEKDILYVGHGHDHPALAKSEVELESFHFIGRTVESGKIKIENVTAQIRYQGKPEKGTLVAEDFEVRKNGGSFEILGGSIKFIFDEPKWAVASGQSLVAFEGERVLGGGIIV